MMTAPPKGELLIVDERGCVSLPTWAWQRLLRMSRRRSHKWRHQKKAVKKQFHKMIKEILREDARNVP